jgi:hypothetical protein
MDDNNTTSNASTRNPPPIAKKCERCGLEFRVWPYRSHARACSAECGAALRRGRATVPRVCRCCGVTFEARLSTVRYDPERGAITCSRDCARKLRWLDAPPPQVRFWLNVEKDGPAPERDPALGNCWLWRLHVERSGYALFAVTHGKHILAHRYSYELEHGQIAEGLVVRHRCDVRHCVRPEHLVAGTQRQNVADTVARGRHAHGERTPISVLTEADVRAIRASTEGLWKLAERFGVSATTIGSVRSRKTWKHVP